MVMTLTKSKYVTYCLCPLKAWRDRYDPLPEQGNPQRQKDGEEVGALARDYFGKNTPVLPRNTANPPMNPGVYAEYPLRSGDLECYVDILKINDDGSIDIYEVKSVNDYESSPGSGKPNKKFMEDVSFQCYVALQEGRKVNSVSLMVLNRDYVYMGGDYDLHSLFKVIPLLDQVMPRMDEVEEKIDGYFALDANLAPRCPLSGTCNEYEGCQYLEECKDAKGLPKTQSVYDLYSCSNKTKYIEEGCLSFEDLVKSSHFEDLSSFNQRMVIYSLRGIQSPYVNKELLKKELKKYRFPLYFFDFETTQEVLPKYPSSRPYQQIPFQYSLHVMNDEDQGCQDVLKAHEEFLGDGVNDPREALIQKMIKDLGTKGKIVAYNMDFERGIIRHLMRDFPQYAKKLEAIHDRFIDLADFFDYAKQIGWDKPKPDAKKKNDQTSIVYHPNQGPSTSIKKVLPAFFPGDPELDYTRLGQVQHGDQASASYKLLRTLNPTERGNLRKDMLDYCCLDTKAMVALFFKLRELQ